MMTWGALHDLTVLDLTQVLAGPFCTMLLADHGANVIKVESPEGDLSRTIGPFFPDDKDQVFGGYFQSVNRNKRSVMLDLKSPADRDRFKAMAAKADVVVENFRVGVMERFDLSYETLAHDNPRLVYAAIRGFGDPRTGESPYAQWPAFDVVAQAMGGFMSITGENEPMKAGPGVGDIVPGCLAAFGILAAVHHAERSGVGQFLDVPMYDAVLALCERIVYQHSYTGTVPGPTGNKHPLAAPFSMFRAQDGHVAIACPIDAQWRQLAALMGRAELGTDPRFATAPERLANASEVDAIINRWSADLTKAEIGRILGGKVPFGPVNDIAEIFADPHVRAHGMLVDLALEGVAERAVVAGTPVRMQNTPGGVHRRAPRLGEHNAEVFAELGI
jgi:crotonobetainyl-CoA:carnitine CoA-transferase CaiB-like acyl-CoA transferase